MRPKSRLSINGADVAPLYIADSYLRRARGLLGTRGIDGALLISPGNSVHGLGMIYVLDVALLDENLKVLYAMPLHPFGLIRPRRGVKQVLEARRGAFAEWDLTVGCQLGIGPAMSHADDA